MKSHLLWDRFLSCWLPPQETTGDIDSNISRALGKTYHCSDGKQRVFAQKGGQSIVIATPEKTTVSTRIPPRSDVDLPDWLTWIGNLSRQEQRALLHDATRDLIAAPRPHVVLKTGRTVFTLNGIVLGEGTVVVVNEPDTTTAIDSVRIRRARRAMEVLGSTERAKKARKLLQDRVEAVGDTDAIDRKIESLIRAVKVDNETFFDALDLLEGATSMELSLARQTS